MRELWVLLTNKRRARHIAVWSTNPGPPGPLCGNRALQDRDPADETIYFEQASEAPQVPWCTRCAAEARALAEAVSR